MMLVAAKWREFSASIPESNDTPPEEEATEASSSRPLRSSRSAASGREEPELPDDEEDEDDEFAEKGRKNKRNRKPTKGGNTNAGKKGKVPTIKIKLGKRKRTSSDDVSADEKDSDAEFEQMLKEAEEASKVVEESKGIYIYLKIVIESALTCYLIFQVKLQQFLVKKQRRKLVTKTRRRRRLVQQLNSHLRKVTAMKLITKIIAKSVNKEEKSFCATLAQEPTI